MARVLPQVSILSESDRVIENCYCTEPLRLVDVIPKPSKSPIRATVVWRRTCSVMPCDIPSFPLATESWMPQAWPHWHSPASWGVPRSSVRCWSCPHGSSGVTVISPARRTLSMPSTRCSRTAEQVRRKANRITPGHRRGIVIHGPPDLVRLSSGPLYRAFPN